MGAKTISAKVFVGNLNYRTTKEELMEFLSPAGEIVDCFLPTDRETGRPRGFGFVTFASPEQATACVEQFDGQDFNGRRLNINPAEERGRRPGGRDRRPGGGRGPVQEFKRGGRREEGGRREGGFRGRREDGGGGGGGGFRGRRDDGGGGGGRGRREEGGGFRGRREEGGGGFRGRREEGGGGGFREDFRGGGRRGPPIEPPPEPVYDTTDRQYQEDEGEVDEWGQPSSGWQKKKKKGKGSRRNLRAKKHDF